MSRKLVVIYIISYFLSLYLIVRAYIENSMQREVNFKTSAADRSDPSPCRAGAVQVDPSVEMDLDDTRRWSEQCGADDAVSSSDV